MSPLPLSAAIFAALVVAGVGACPADYMAEMKRCEEPIKHKVITSSRNCGLLFATTSCELEVIERCPEKVMADFQMTPKDYEMVLASMRAMVDGAPEECKTPK